MTLPMPNLDDRSFEQLMAEARQQIAAGSTAYHRMPILPFCGCWG